MFCGENSQWQKMNSVEKLSIDADPNLQVSKQWEVIPATKVNALPALCSPLSVALNSNEIIIIGGYEYNKPYVQLYDIRTDSC